MLFTNVSNETPCQPDTYFECIADCQCRKLSNATWHLNKKTLSHTTILLFFKTGKEFGFVKPVPVTYQAWFWKTKLLLKIFVLAKIISKLSNTSTAIGSCERILYLHTGKMLFPNQDFQVSAEGNQQSRTGGGTCRTAWFVSQNRASPGDILTVTQRQANVRPGVLRSCRLAPPMYFPSYAPRPFILWVQGVLVSSEAL